MLESQSSAQTVQNQKPSYQAQLLVGSETLLGSLSKGVLLTVSGGRMGSTCPQPGLT
jgi:hypothetical protein